MVSSSKPEKKTRINAAGKTKKRRNRTAYMREFMRKKRARERYSRNNFFYRLARKARKIVTSTFGV